MFGLVFFKFAAVYRRMMTLIKTAEARSVAEIGKSVFSVESLVLSKRERTAIRVGNHCHIRGELFVFPHAGSIRIADWCYIGPGSKIWSSSKEGVSIGDRVLISMNVQIHDTDGHPNDPVERFAQTRAILTSGHPADILSIAANGISIGNDVWIGFNAAILKGVIIGEGAIVGACSVVTRDVAPYTVVAGNPARFIRSIERV